MKIRSCPFCGGNAVLCKWGVTDEYHVKCQTDKCRAIGPEKLSAKKAIKSWNRASKTVWEKRGGTE